MSSKDWFELQNAMVGCQKMGVTPARRQSACAAGLSKVPALNSCQILTAFEIVEAKSKVPIYFKTLRGLSSATQELSVDDDAEEKLAPVS